MPAGRGLIDRRRLEDLLAVYDQQLARLGAQVTAARQAFVGVVQDELAAAFAAITRSDPLRRPARPTRLIQRIAQRPGFDAEGHGARHRLRQAHPARGGDVHLAPPYQGLVPRLARAFGGKHHTTVISAVQKIEHGKDDAFAPVRDPRTTLRGPGT